MRRFLQEIKYYWLPIVTIFALAILIPVNWLHGGYVIAGHDTGFPILPIPHFFDRIFVWTQRLGLGQDQSYAVGGFFIHGLEALVYSIVHSLSVTQMVDFAVWFVLPGITMLYLMHTLFGRRLITNSIAAIFYMLNHYTLQAWLIAERTKFTLYAAAPVLVAITIAVFEGRSSIFVSAMLASFIIFLLNGGGFLPLYGGIIVIFLVLIAYYLYVSFSWQLVRRMCLYVVTFAVFSLLLNSFWILPYAQLTASQFTSQLSEIGGIEGILGWIAQISANASLFNLLRLQGIQEWYVNLGHPYAQVFLKNPLFLFIGLCIPFLAFASLFIAKRHNERKYIYLFGFAALISMIFVGGNHPPLGFIYDFLVRYVPGFAIFRTPFYKFGAALWFSYAVLIGYTVGEGGKIVLEKIHLPATRKYGNYLLFATGVCIILFYHFPFLSPILFNYIKDKRTDRIQVPQYVVDFGDWLKMRPSEDRLLLLPPTDKDNLADTYIWRYWSLAPVTSLLVNNTAITNQVGNAGNEKILVNELFDQIDTGKNTWEKIAYYLGITTILFRNDFAIPQDNTTPADFTAYNRFISNLPLGSMKKSFGMWNVYELPPEKRAPLLTLAPSVTVIDAPYEKAMTAFTLDAVDPKNALFITDNEDEYKVSSNKVFNNEEAVGNVVIYPTCFRCDLYDPEFSLDAPERILPSSILFPLIQFQEKQQLEAAKSQEAKETVLFDLFAKRVNEMKVQLEDKVVQQENLRKSIAQTLMILNQLQASVHKTTASELIDNNRYLKLYGYLLTAKPFFISAARHFISAEDKGSVDTLIANTNKEITTLDMLTWKTVNTTEKRYIVDVPEDNTYTLSLYSPTLASNLKVGDTFTYILDGTLSTAVVTTNNNDWLLANKIPLTKGLHRLSLLDDSFQNMVTLPSQIRSDPHITSSSSDSLTFQVVGKSQNCYSFPVANVNKQNLYRISFRYLLPQQERLLFAVGDTVKDESSIYFQPEYRELGDPQELSNAGTSSFQTFYSPLSSAMSLTFCNQYRKDKSVNEVSDFEITDIVVEQISEPTVALTTTNNTMTSVDQTFSYQKINQVHYKLSVHTQNKTILTFAQSFQPGWQLFSGISGNSGQHTLFDKAILKIVNKVPIAQKSHFQANGFSNGWVLDPGTYTLDLIYVPQLYYYVGVLFSCIGILIGGIMFGIWIVKRKTT